MNVKDDPLPAQVDGEGLIQRRRREQVYLDDAELSIPDALRGPEGLGQVCILAQDVFAVARQHHGPGVTAAGACAGGHIRRLGPVVVRRRLYVGQGVVPEAVRRGGAGVHHRAGVGVHKGLPLAQQAGKGPAAKSEAVKARAVGQLDVGINVGVQHDPGEVHVLPEHQGASGLHDGAHFGGDRRAVGPCSALQRHGAAAECDAVHISCARGMEGAAVHINGTAVISIVGQGEYAALVDGDIALHRHGLEDGAAVHLRAAGLDHPRGIARRKGGDALHRAVGRQVGEDGPLRPQGGPGGDGQGVAVQVQLRAAALRRRGGGPVQVGAQAEILLRIGVPRLGRQGVGKTAVGAAQGDGAVCPGIVHQQHRPALSAGARAGGGVGGVGVGLRRHIGQLPHVPVHRRAVRAGKGEAVSQHVKQGGGAAGGEPDATEAAAGDVGGNIFALGIALKLQARKGACGDVHNGDLRGTGQLFGGDRAFEDGPVAGTVQRAAGHIDPPLNGGGHHVQNGAGIVDHRGGVRGCKHQIFAVQRQLAGDLRFRGEGEVIPQGHLCAYADGQAGLDAALSGAAEDGHRRAAVHDDGSPAAAGEVMALQVKGIDPRLEDAAGAVVIRQRVVPPQEDGGVVRAARHRGDGIVQGGVVGGIHLRLEDGAAGAAHHAAGPGGQAVVAAGAQAEGALAVLPAVGAGENGDRGALAVLPAAAPDVLRRARKVVARGAGLIGEEAAAGGEVAVQRPGGLVVVVLAAEQGRDKGILHEGAAGEQGVRLGVDPHAAGVGAAEDGQHAAGGHHRSRIGIAAAGVPAGDGQVLQGQRPAVELDGRAFHMGGGDAAAADGDGGGIAGECGDPEHVPPLALQRMPGKVQRQVGIADQQGAAAQVHVIQQGDGLTGAHIGNGLAQAEVLHALPVPHDLGHRGDAVAARDHRDGLLDGAEAVDLPVRVCGGHKLIALRQQLHAVPILVALVLDQLPLDAVEGAVVGGDAALKGAALEIGVRPAVAPHIQRAVGAAEDGEVLARRGLNAALHGQVLQHDALRAAVGPDAVGALAPLVLGGGGHHRAVFDHHRAEIHIDRRVVAPQVPLGGDGVAAQVKGHGGGDAGL